MNNFNNKKLYTLTLYSGIIKTALTIITGIITVPFTLKYFGTEKYGVWNVITSFIVFLSMTNLGLNSAASILINKNGNFFSKIQILKKSFIILSIIIPIILISLFLFDYLNPDWIKIINSPKSIEIEAKHATIVMVIFSIINLPFSLFTSAINGFQKNHIENIFVIFNLFLSVSCLVFVIYFKKNLVFYAYLSSAAILILNIIKAFYFKILIKREANSELHSVNLYDSDTSYKTIMITGYRCMLGAVAAMFLLNTDNIIIAKYLGIEFVTEFSVTFKLYTTVFSLIYLFNSSIVPLVGKNISDRKYLNKIYNNTLLTVIIFGGLFWVGAVAFGKTLIYLWVGKNGYAGVFVLIFLGAYSYIFSIVNLNYIMINTLNHLKGIVLITWIEGILNIVLSIFLGKIFGLAGIAAGTFLGTLLSPFLLFSIILKRRTDNLIFQNNSFILKHFLITIIPSILLAYLINQNSTNTFFVFIQTCLLCISYLILSYMCLPMKYRNLVGLYIKYKRKLIFQNKINF